ncbi:MAG: glycosyltransferase family 2 protein [Clostridia bacterium]|nr:glycosyltransferase family 2 protein [Clostridia bacterium]
MNEKISIIVPVYNVEKYVRKCLESLIHQTYQNIEIIIVNANSTDRSKEICEEFAKKDSRIIIVNQENKGISVVRNTGLELASGKYIGFVDSDDYIKKDMFEILYHNMQKTEADISVCSFVKVKEDEQFIEKQQEKADILQYNKEQALEQLVSEKIGSYVWNKLYKRELFFNIQFPVGRKMEDLAVMYLIFEKANKIVLTHKIEYYYLQRTSSILGNINLGLVLDVREFTNERYSYISNKYPQLKQVCIKNRIENIYIYHRNLCQIREHTVYNSKEFLEEYHFYKENYKKLKKEILKDKKSMILKMEYRILYVNRKLFKSYYDIKNFIKGRNK